MRHTALRLVMASFLLGGMARATQGTQGPARGTASISGVVIDAKTSEPIRRASVTASTAGYGFSSRINTDGQGQFGLDDLPAGRYTVTATAPGYLSMSRGAVKPGAPGTSIDLADGQSLQQLTIAMTRGAVIAGVITDAAGDPVPRVAVRLWKWGFSSTTGQRAVVGTPVSALDTDDQGAFRLIGVPPGEYFVSTPLESAWGGAMGLTRADDTPRLTRDDVDALRRSLGTSAGQPLAQVPTLKLRAPPPTLAVPTFYPGTIRPSEATPIVVEAGEEHPGVNFAVRAAPVAVIRGTLALPAGAGVVRTAVQLLPTEEAPWLGFGRTRFVAVSENKAFLAEGVPPGDYVLSAQAFFAPSPGAPGGPAEVWWATLPVTVDGHDISGLVLSPAPGITVSGRVQFDGTAPPDVSKNLRVGLRAVLGRGEVSVGGGAQPIDSAGQFTITGVNPGRYLIEVTSGASWRVKSGMVNGADAADVPVVLGAANVSDVLVTLTTHQAALSGTVVAASSAPSQTHWVIVFPVDRAFRLPRGRRIAALRPAVDGVFNAGPLPPGEYFIAAVESVEENQWFDPAFLSMLEANAMRISLVDDERRQIVLRVR
jgi:hypothetical protein